MKSEVKKIYVYSLVTFVLLSAMLFGSLVWNFHLIQDESQNIARNIAETNFNRDQVLRLWIAKQGGVYVAVSNSVRPNPNLTYVEDRDIYTPHGKLLTLMNPAYVLRLVSEEHSAMFALKSRLTSLNPIREGNASDAWERDALLELQRGVAEFNEIVSIDGKQYFRFIRPMITKKECLICHAHQGYKVGDVRGGLSISVPMEPLDKLQSEHYIGIFSTAIGAWLIGFAVIIYITSKMKALLLERFRMEEDLRQYYHQLEGLVSERTEELRIKSQALEEKNNALNAKVAQEEAAQRSLAQAYGFVRTIFNSLKDPIAIVDVKDFTIVAVNKEFLSEYGMKDESEAVGRGCYEVMHHKTECCDQGKDCPLLKTVNKGVTFETVHEHFDSQGQALYHEIYSTPIFDQDGKVVQIIHLSRDITEKRIMEDNLQRRQQELEETNGKLSTLLGTLSAAKKEWEETFDNIEDMIILLADDGNIRRCNSAFAGFAKKDYKDIVGVGFLRIIDEFGFECELCTEPEVDLHDPVAGRWYNMRKHGNIITIRDLTDIKNITESLEITNQEVEKNRKAFEDALDELSYLIQKVTTSKDFSVRFTNPHLPKCYEIMSCTKTECPLHGAGATRCWQTAGTFCGGKVCGKFAEKISNCMQCPVYQFATSDPIYQIGENFNNMMHILEIQHVELETAYNNLKLAQMQIAQQEKMASIGQLAAGVAHEINNPTGFIMSNLGSLKKYIGKIKEITRLYSEAAVSLPEDVAARLATGRKALKIDFILDDIDGLVAESIEGTERIKKIVEDLKNFSRVDEAEHKLADINAGIESTLNIVWNELKYKATVIKEYGEIPPIVCNPGQMNQVFMNLLVNAAQAIETKGVIGIKTWAENGNIFISISDTGNGIPNDKMNRIFEPFFTTKEVGKGTGLGLSITYDIIKKHNGEISVESEVGAGTTFTIKIPIVEAENG